MTKLQKRAKPEALYLPVTLQAGVSPATSPPLPSNSKYPGVKSNFSTPLSPFEKTHRRAVSTPRTPQTQWPLIATSSPPSVAYPISPYHDTKICGANCTRCGKKTLIQLNSPPSKNVPNSAAPLRPIPQAHMRAVSDGVVTKGPKRLSITTTPAALNLNPGKPPCCQKCGRHKRPASLPMQSSVKHVKVQTPSTHQRCHDLDSMNYSILRTNISGTHSGTPHPVKLPSHPPSPTSPDHFYPRTSTSPPGSHEHIISPLTPRRKVAFAFPSPSKSSSSASNTLYSPTSQSEETAEIGTGRLINLISNAILETSPPLPTGAKQTYHAYVPLLNSHSRNTSREAVVGLGLSETKPNRTISSSTPDTHPTYLLNARSPISLPQPSALHPIELDSVPIGSTTADIISGYSDDDSASLRHREDPESSASYAEYTHDWTDALSIPVIRLPSVKEGISRFRSLRGGGSQSVRNGGPGRRPSVRERFGSLRGSGNGNTHGMQQQQQGWYSGLGREGGRYQALESSVEIGVY